MADLRPPLLDEYGLGAALGWHAEEFARRTGVRVAVADRDPAESKNARPEAAVALFRIAQEALNNVLKHAKATNVRLEVSATDEELILHVQRRRPGLRAGARAPRPLGHDDDARARGSRRRAAAHRFQSRRGHAHPRPGAAVVEAG